MSISHARRASADVVRLVAQCLDVRGADPLARTVARLRETDAMLVFDSCEHVIEETARVVEAVLAGLPGCAGARDEPRGAPRAG